MNIRINESNNNLLNYLKDIQESEHNTIINKILKIGFEKYINDINNNNSNSVFNLFDEKFNNLKLLINEIKLEQQNNILVLNNNNYKGLSGEKLIYDFFKKNNYNIEDTSEIAHSGDMCLRLDDINQNVLIEIKNYKNTIDQKQIDKFYYDLNYTGIKLGIFISLHSKIVNIKHPIEWKINESGKILIFISECKEEYLYLAIHSLILLFKNNNYKSNFQLIENTEIFNDIKYLSTQKDTINKIKHEILSIHENNAKTMLALYNNLCTFDNNFNYILNKVYNKLDKELNSLTINNVNDNKLYLQLDNINISNTIKDILNTIVSDLSNLYKLEILDKKIKITKNDRNIGEIKILKTTLNLLLNSGLEIKNINNENWNQIKILINN
jgi:hypothetical protein